MFPEMVRKLFWKFFVTRATCHNEIYDCITSLKNTNLRLQTRVLFRKIPESFPGEVSSGEKFSGKYF
jgi:hypothetical protein